MVIQTIAFPWTLWHRDCSLEFVVGSTTQRPTNMKNKVVALTLGLGLAGAMSSMALTLPSSGGLRFLDPAGSDPGYGSAGGGEFYIDVGPVYGSTDFKSFCLELGETIAPGSGITYSYNVAPDQAARGGGGGAVSGKDVLSKASAWLYAQFASNPAGIGYTSAQENTFQNAIWGLESEIALNMANPFVAAAVAALPLSWNLDSAYGEFGTYVLNVYEGTSRTARQDILYWERPTVADGGMTLLMLGAGLTMVGIARRRLA